ncbi:MAG: Ig-like domain-containing protein [Patescibacteria group bacterium]|nr:Ig-like domain-containing protein [Patescibacteria group bacterium]
MRNISPFNQPKQTLYFVLGAVFVVVIAGSVVGLNQAGFSFAEAVNNLGQAFSRIGGADLVVTVQDHTLPADGKSQTIIYAKTVGSQATITASLLQGSGTIQKATSDNSEQTNFLYTAGSQLGTVEILIQSGSLRQSVTIQLAEATTPAAPAIVSPVDGSTISESYPIISGTGPANTKIIITNNGNQNTIAQTDESGNFSIKLTKPLYNGQHTLAATTMNELKITSPLSNLVTITVKTAPAKLDTKNIRISPSPALAGEAFGVFVPASLNASRVVIEFDSQEFELFDHNESSIFTGTLPAPLESGVYFGNIVLTDEAGNSTRFEEALRVPVRTS